VTPGGARPPLPGFPYEVVRQLGAGGMGTVYEVRRPGDPRRLAAKFMTSTSVQARARFQREGEVVARLEHPGIVPVRGSGQLADGTPYLLFDLVDGRSLKALLEEGPLPEPRALALAEGIARALGHAHRQGVVHRDIKPDNILVDAQGAPKVADFGIAHVADAERLTRTGQVTGTVLYMAREQLAAGGGIGPWTDVHALGAVLFECLAGRPAFEGDSPHNVVAQVLHTVPPDLRTLRSDLSAGVAAIAARCLAKKAEERYPDGDALAEDLAALRRGDSISAVSAFLRAARQRVARRVVAGLGAALVLVLLGAGGLWLRADRQRAARSLDLRALAAELDDVARELGPEPSGRAVEAADRALLRAREQGPGEPVLDAALARLQTARDRGDAARRLAALREGGGDGALGPALAAALEALARVAPQAGAGAAPFEEGRGATLALAGRLEAARAALTPLGGDAPAAPIEGQEAEAWLASAGARRAWRLAWVELRLGQAEAALARVASAPPSLHLRLRLAALADAGAGAAQEATQVGGEASALRGPEGVLLAALARLEGLAAAASTSRGSGAGDTGADTVPIVTGQRLALLADLRALACPPARARVAPAHQARASLAEGELCLALGWGASAALAYERAVTLARAARAELDVEWPAAPAPVGASLHGAGPGRRLVAPDLAAALGLAAARATGLDAKAAAEAAAAARDRATLAEEATDPATAWAVTLAGALGQPVDTLGYVQAGHAYGAWGWDRARLLPWVGSTVRARLVADAWAALTVATRTAESVAVDAAARPAAALARAAVAEDPGDDPPRAARGWAALAAAEADLGHLEASRRALDRARGLAPELFEVHTGSAHEALARGQAAEVVTELEAALAALDARAPDARVRVVAAMQLLAPFRMALQQSGQEVDALRVGELLAGAADAGKLPPSLRAQLHQLTLRMAQSLGRDDVAGRAEVAIRAAAQDDRALRPFAARIAGALGQEGEFGDTPELRAAFDAVLRGCPGDPGMWRNHHVAYGRYGNGGFDDLAIGFELDPWDTLAYLNSPSFSPRTMGATEAKTARDAVGLLASELGPPYNEIPARRDDDVRLALGGVYALELRVALAGDVLARDLAAADAVHRRLPGLVSSLLLGRLQLGAGDFGGAAETLARAAQLPEPLTLSVGKPRPWVDLYSAMALGGARRWAEARAQLERVAAGPYRGSSLQGHRIREEPLLWEDAGLSGTLPAWAEAVAKTIDAR
jgi:hypothetical protein